MCQGTHRFAVDWLFDRIHLDSKIQIRYIDTKHQVADILTKGNYTRHEWNNLLHLFNISHFLLHSLHQKFQLGELYYDRTKIQEQKEERFVSKSRPSLNRSSLFATSSSAASSPIASKSAGIVGASGRPGSRINLAAR